MSRHARAPAFDVRAVRRELEAGRAVEVRSSLGQVVFFLILAVVIIGLGLVVIFEGFRHEPGFGRVYWFVIGGFVLLFGIHTLVGYAYRLLFCRIALVLDADGVHDYTHGRRAVSVPWDDVERVFVGEFRRRVGGSGAYTAQRFASIAVSDADALKKRVGLRRYAALALQQGQTGALVNISENLLPGSARHWVRIIGRIAAERRERAPRA
jgi:hypothetical protein